jgi:hypothetical protein
MIFRSLSLAPRFETFDIQIIDLQLFYLIAKKKSERRTKYLRITRSSWN